MKRLFLAGVGLLALAGAAAAADLPPGPGPYYKAPAYLPPAYNWSGFYLGVNGGGGFGTSNWDSAGGFNMTGGLVGGTVGYNYQMGPAVFGVEGDIDWSDISGSTTGGGCVAGCTTNDTWLSTVRGRLGYAADRFMPFVTGGGAFGNINASTPGSRGPAPPTPAGPSAAGWSSPSPVIGPPKRNISMSTSGSSIAAPAAPQALRPTTSRSRPASFAPASITGSDLHATCISARA